MKMRLSLKLIFLSCCTTLIGFFILNCQKDGNILKEHSGEVLNSLDENSEELNIHTLSKKNTPSNLQSYFNVSQINLVSVKNTHKSVLELAPNDLLAHGKDFNYLPGVKNPCFVTQGTGPVIKRFHCIPYFFLAGTEKCGSSDLTQYLLYHHHVYRPDHNTESHWFDGQATIWEPAFRHPNAEHRPTTIGGYSQCYKNQTVSKSNGTFELLRCLERNYIGPNMHNKDCSHILGDFTPRYISFGDGWNKIPGNEGLSEPEYLIIHEIKALNPQAKILFIVRDPTQRMFSSYKYFMAGTNAFERCKISDPSNDFHNKVANQIQVWKNCLASNTLRRCLYLDWNILRELYSPDPKSKPCVHMWDQYNPHQLRMGLYYYFLKEWFKVFPQGQILVLELEKYSESRLIVMQTQVLPFLGLESFNEETLNKIHRMEQNNRIVNRKKTDYKLLDKTKVLLDEFYQEHNQLLTDFLKHLNNNY